MLNIRELVEEDVPICAATLEELPLWFGMPEVNRGYVEALRRLPGFVAEQDGEVVGFLALERYGEAAVEIHVLAVRPGLHRRGIGHALVERARCWCREAGARWLHVKTRGPSTPDPDYELTRHFYLAEGFDPLYESATEWGPNNSALVMIQAVGDAEPGG